MLDRIINIKTDLNYTSGHGRKIQDRAYHGDIHSHLQLKDSIRFSPAAVFLSKINWKLREIRRKGKEKLNLLFTIDDLEFLTEIDLLNFYAANRQVYCVTRSFDQAKPAFKIIMHFSARKKSRLNENDITYMKLTGIPALFSEAFPLQMNRNNDEIYENIYALADNLKPDIEGEFDYINSALIVLNDKLGGGNFLNKFNFENDFKDSIILEKITAIND